MMKLEDKEDMGEIVGVVKREQEEKEQEMEKREDKVGDEEEEEKTKKREKKKSKGKKGQNPHKNRACVDCMKRCIRTHCRASSSSSKAALLIPTPPSFFKIMIGYFSESMDIPPSFAKTIFYLLDSNVYLEDTFGLRWRVKLCLLNGLLSFGHGWENFVLDHAISVGEFLVFRQIGRSVFTVQIFAPSACERLYLCEKNKRQSRKRKCRASANSPDHQTVKLSKNKVDICKKKLCNADKVPLKFQKVNSISAPDSSKIKMAVGSCSTNGPQDGLGPSNTSVHLGVNFKRPKAASELQCSETSLQTPDVSAARSQETADVPTGDLDKVQETSKDGEPESADDCSEKEAVCNDMVRGELTSGTVGAKVSEHMVGIDLSSNKEVTMILPVEARNSEACQDVSDSITRDMVIVEKESLHSYQDRPMEIYTALGLEDEHIETENQEDSNLPTITNASANESLAMMDLNEVSMDDLFLSADMYELINDGSDLCNPEAFSGELNIGLTANAQTSSFNCVENDLQNLDSSMGIAHRFLMPEPLSCVQNKEMTDAPRISADGDNVTVHDIDINAFPDNELATFREDSPFHETNAEVHFIARVLDGYNKNKEIVLFSCEDNQLVQKAGIAPVNASGKEDSLQVGPGDSALITRIPNPHEDPDIRKKSQEPGNSSEGFQIESTQPGDILAVNHGKFSIAVPAANETWLELPSRLPILPRTKKQGRKIVILKDPSMRLWPVLYQCSPRFNGFISGWEDITRENNLQEGDTCEFELCTNSEQVFQVRVLKSE